MRMRTLSTPRAPMQMVPTLVLVREALVVAVMMMTKRPMNPSGA